MDLWITLDVNRKRINLVLRTILISVTNIDINFSPYYFEQSIIGLHSPVMIVMYCYLYEDMFYFSKLSVTAKHFGLSSVGTAEYCEKYWQAYLLLQHFLCVSLTGNKQVFLSARCSMDYDIKGLLCGQCRIKEITETPTKTALLLQVLHLLASLWYRHNGGVFF